MQDATDMDLLRQYARGNSDTAFTELVLRHLNLVYCAALRKTGNPHAAEEVTQAVFIILAQKAGRISDKTILPGWLYQTTRLTAASFLKSQTRRIRREQEAYMQTEFHAATPDEAWEQLAPLLEDAMGQLGEKDRAALLLRFFSGKSFSEVGAAAGVSENAAKKRVGHALEKLRRFFKQRGITLSAAVIASAVAENSVQAAPVGLAKTVTAVAITKGAAASSSTLTIIKGALKIMAWTKMKTAIVVGVGLLLAAGGVTGVAFTMAYTKHAAAVKLLNQVEETYSSLETYSFDGERLFETHSKTNATTFSVRLARPCSYLTEELTAGTDAVDDIYSAIDDYSLSYAPWMTNQLYKIQSTPSERLAHFNSMQLDIAMATCLPTQFFFNSNPSSFHLFSLKNINLKISLLNDQRIESTDCYRLLVIIPGHQMRLTLWIGKTDHLIYQTEQWIENGESYYKTTFPAMEREIYRNIITNVPFARADFISDKIPAGLKTSDHFP